MNTSNPPPLPSNTHSKTQSSVQQRTHARLHNSQNSQNKTLKKFLLVLLVIVIIACVAVWFFTHYEYVSKDKQLLNTKSQSNPYLVAQLYLNARHDDGNTDNNDDALESDDYRADEEYLDSDYDNEYDDGYDDEYEYDDKEVDNFARTDIDMSLGVLLDNLPALPSEQSLQRPTIVIKHMSNELSESKYAQLMDWVQQGGHIITFADDGNGLTEYLQLSTTYYSDSARHESTNTQGFEDDFNLELDRIGLAITESTPKSTPENAPESARKNTNTDDNTTTADASNKKHTVTWRDTPFDASKKSGSSAQSFDGQYAHSLEQRKKVRTQLTRLLNSHNFSFMKASASVPKENSASSASSLLINSDYQYYFDSDERKSFYDRYEQARPYNAINILEHNTDASNSEKQQHERAQVIRHYFTQQLALLKKDIAQGAFASQTSDSTQRYGAKDDKDAKLLYDGYNQDMQDMAISIAYLLTMNDRYLSRFLPSMNGFMLDSHYGEGRITILADDDSLWTNPTIKSSQFTQEYRDVSTQLVELLAKNESADENQLFNFQDYYDDDYYSAFDYAYLKGINQADNAHLLSVLTAHSSSVLFLPTIDIDPLLLMLWKHHFWVVFGLLLLLSLWLWSLNNKFGKQQSLPDSNAYDISRYFKQIGRYGWEYDHGNKLSQPARQQVLMVIKKQIAHAQHTLHTSTINTHTDIPTMEEVVALHALLKQRLTARIAQLATVRNNTDKSNTGVIYTISDDMTDVLLQDKEHIYQLISVRQLNKTLRVNNELLEQISASDFQQHTQTLWLIMWLLA